MRAVVWVTDKSWKARRFILMPFHQRTRTLPIHHPRITYLQDNFTSNIMLIFMEINPRREHQQITHVRVATEAVLSDEPSVS